MSSVLTAARTWLEARYQAAGLPAPGFRWVRREDIRTAAPGPTGALVLEDRELRLLLLLVNLGPGGVEARIHEDLALARALGSACMPGPERGLPGAAGAWRVALHWLGTEDQVLAWRRALMGAFAHKAPEMVASASQDRPRQ